MLQKIPLAGTYHRFKEGTVVACDFKEFQATLTNKRLIISYGSTSESIPLHLIHGITVFDDLDEYRQRVETFTQRRKRLYWYISTILSASLLYWLTPAIAWYGIVLSASIIGTFLSIFLPINKGTITTPSVLIVILDCSTKEYAFEQKKGLNMKAMAAFIMKVDEALF